MSLLKILSRDRNNYDATFSNVKGTPANCRIQLAQSIKGVYRVHTIICPNAAPPLSTITNPALVITVNGTPTNTGTISDNTNIILPIIEDWGGSTLNAGETATTTTTNTNNLPVRDRYYDLDNIIVDLNTNLANNAVTAAVGLSVVYESHSSRLRFLKTDATMAVTIHTILDNAHSTAAPVLGITENVEMLAADTYKDTQAPVSLARDLLCYQINIAEAEFGVRDTKGRTSGIVLPIDENSHTTLIYRGSMHGEQYLNFPTGTSVLTIKLTNDRGEELSSLKGGLGQDYMILLEKVNNVHSKTFSKIPNRN